MRILGIDPGLGITGYGLIEADGNNVRLIEAGVIRSNAKDKMEKRLAGIYKKVTDLIKDTMPEAVVLEELYSHYKHPKTSILMAHGRGAICLAVEHRNVALVNYPTTKIKKAITGRGRASKEQMQRTVASLLGLKNPPEPFDITDALALAITHANIWGHRNDLQGFR
ncbi:MAG: crossover junction endodeoxyribonuclease RuvC [Candidatus Omnitrophica bacterium CG02_land_8_20_14_3_00__42_8]|nr:MAG: crossover junction endodeoxyribonuclease RuvC [Candidatus Omnitrophica bacterium CG02_land_8_20_14_3_00__42_8]PIW68597.1 MAG: crossover junction endodeoxyribonuclease RuvC [Candidatus Omnitrophica bacterium CG12_big_fil_rev_8_21_14_0_65_42_8]